MKKIEPPLLPKEQISKIHKKKTSLALVQLSMIALTLWQGSKLTRDDLGGVSRIAVKSGIGSVAMITPFKGLVLDQGQAVCEEFNNLSPSGKIRGLFVLGTFASYLGIEVADRIQGRRKKKLTEKYPELTI